MAKWKSLSLKASPNPSGFFSNLSAKQQQLQAHYTITRMPLGLERSVHPSHLPQDRSRAQPYSKQFRTTLRQGTTPANLTGNLLMQVYRASLPDS